ncbi:PLX-2 protein [Aphelenchoides avenae]|nr:PLX-2 protein [Aphelenchus avenae]
MNDDADPGANSESSEAGLFCVITPDLPDESVRGRKLRVPAVLRDGEVGCSPARLSYTPSIPRQNYSLELTRGDDVIDKTTVTVYKCQEMASDCSQCLSLDPKWRCVWCDGGCHYHEQCLKVPEKPRADALCTQPVILSFTPESGPEEGGTVVEIRGRDLGSRIQDVQGRVFVAGSKCHVTDYQISVRILCVLEKGTAAGPVRVTIGKTGKRSVESSTMFHFRSPTPRSVYPVFGPISGGTQLSIYGDNLHVGSNVSVHLDNLPCQVLPEGSNFDSVLSAKMYLLAGVDSPTEVVSELGDCQIHNSSHMHCRSPRLLLSATHRKSTYARWPVGFVMDGVRAVQNLGYRVQLTTVPDPQFSPFKGVKMQSPDQPLIIRGNYLSQAATIEEYMITVGTERCQVFMLEAHEVLCRLPDVQPSATDDAGVELSDGRPLVVVHVGALRAELGMLEYDLSGNDLFRLNRMRLVLIALSAVGVLGAVTLLVFLLWRRRSSEHDRVYKRIQLQLEQMECSVRNECKQAFAELQTDILTDLKATIDDTGIPYHDRAEFVSRLLFRDSTDAAILNGYGGGGMSIYSSQLPMALAQFDSLLWNRQFLVVLVQMAESDQSITTSERSTLSSLLIVALSRNMVYCTDVILLLLSQHIERNANGKHPHLLFRRSESLVEKLFQHWLTICLFSYLQSATGPGRNFFVLYKALKCQIEKGPVDSVTGNARYSLSEQNLLREPVEAEIVTLLVIPADGFDQAPVTCKVLDCDTISQVKSKLIDLLYRNQPFSTRIATDQFDLEWKCPRRGCILLLDDDRPQIKGQKKLNTVAYYDIPNNALLTMQTRSSHSWIQRYHVLGMELGPFDRSLNVALVLSRYPVLSLDATGH